MEKYVWLTCAGTLSEVQTEAMREYFPDVVGNLDYKEINFNLDDYSDIIAISGDMEEEELNKVVGAEDYDTVAFRLYTIEPEDMVEIVDTLEIESQEEGNFDVHIYHSPKEINGVLYNIYYAEDVNA